MSEESTWAEFYRSCFLAAMFGACAGLVVALVEQNTRVEEFKDEAVKLGHARWEITERVSEGRMGRKQIIRTSEFKWNDRKGCE